MTELQILGTKIARLQARFMALKKTHGRRVAVKATKVKAHVRAAHVRYTV